MVWRLRLLLAILLVTAAACSQSTGPASFAELGSGPSFDIPLDIGRADLTTQPESWDFSFTDPDVFVEDAGDAGPDTFPMDTLADIQQEIPGLEDADSGDFFGDAFPDWADSGTESPADWFDATDSQVEVSETWDLADEVEHDNFETDAAEVNECGGTPEEEELCDGVDNDCDGDTDEDFEGGPCWVDNDFGSCPGATACLEGELVCVGLPAQLELCDGVDNDCNGETDEGFGQTTCGLGICLHTVENCGDGAPNVCDPMAGAEDEQCNGADDDCDGSVDEGDQWGECVEENEFGSCSGFAVCKTGALLCKAVPPAQEVCDGTDNNCDGLIDEGLEGLPCLVENAFGACPGLAQCDDAVSSCLGPTPALDVCDGVDNDCNGEIDDASGGDPCWSENELGACPGLLVCTDGALVCDAPVPEPEICDGVDNNCEGTVDEDTSGEQCSAQNDFGVCPGELHCVAGELQCDAPSAALEICDGIDNDCNGEADDGLGSTQCGLGVCQHTVANCLAGLPQECDPNEGIGVEECDGLDNDCDGAIDEGLGSTECGLGACKHTVFNCIGGVPQVCDSLEGSGLEECDGEDNDCDGSTDEELGATTCGLGECLHAVDNCVGGIPQNCDAMEGTTLEECDGKDNDCDGSTDEDLGSTTCGLGECLHTVDNCVGGISQTCDAMEGVALETCDGKDNDCDGETDEEFPDQDLDGTPDCVDEDDDGDGDPDETDCSPLDPAIFHGQEELCYNDTDDDCDQTTADECILQSCQAIVDAAPGAADGQYDIDPDGDGGEAPFAVECKMDGGAGWIAFSISDSDGVVVGEYSTYNPWHKCADDGAAHFNWLDGEGEASADYSPATTFVQDVPLGYRNPGTGTLYSAGQLEAVRTVLTELSPATRMVAVTGDDDYGNYQAGAGYGHEVYVMGVSGEWKLLTPGTNGECGGGTIWPQFGSESAFYLWATDPGECETDGHTGLGGPNLGALPAGDILPFKVRLVVKTGGGVAFGWEEKEFLVR